ncbi:MAG: hypothetical protein PHQ21_01700 [Firmicutes bacterium]|nr:hypothetical protein [Bacillota bacterium]
MMRLSRICAEVRYGAKLMPSWIHLVGLVALAIALVEATPGQPISSLAGDDRARVAQMCMRMAEVYLPMLVPVFAATALAPEQTHGCGELAATWPGSLRRTVFGRLIVVVAALSVPTVATTAWAVRVTGGRLTVWELVRAAVPTMWALIGATVLGAVVGGVLGGFGLGFGWWALDRLAGGSVTRHFYLFGTSWPGQLPRTGPVWFTPGLQKLLLLTMGSLLLCFAWAAATRPSAWQERSG